MKNVKTHKRINNLFSEFSFELYAGVRGGLCNDANEVIRSKEQCTDALEKLGYQPLSGWWTGFYSSAIPSGCSVRSEASNNPHFEESPTGLGTGRGDLIPICIRPHELSGNFLSRLCQISS